MPAITPTNPDAKGEVALTKTVLDGATDTLEYKPARAQYLILDNVTAGALTPTIIGDAATTHHCQGLGDVDVSTGYTLASIAAGDTVVMDVDEVRAYLVGNVSITNGTGIEAALLEM